MIIIRNFSITLAVTLTAFTLTACGGSGSQEAGITAMVQTTYLSSSTASGDPDAETDPASEASSIKSIYRDDNMLIQLQLGLINLRAVKLMPCTSVVSSAARQILDFIIPSAMAHSAHIPSGPAGVIDVLKPDLLVWDLGELSATPGDYCGISLEIANVDGHHNMHTEEEEGVDMAGKGILVSPCYYPDTAGSPQTPTDSQLPHECIEAAYSGEAITSNVLFSEPLKLNADHRSAHLMLATAYDIWFNGLDMTVLADNSAEQAKLTQNVLDSFYLYSAE